ncbi:hypothetical protein, partial [Amycolatopsis sp. cmx-8-4]|uniref:hypothetical protein n=1 Tax=Amycolatopsis sp. cmx-8-4 TaxID=2790947 RepID=UPI00397D11B2
ATDAGRRTRRSDPTPSLTPVKLQTSAGDFQEAPLAHFAERHHTIPGAFSDWVIPSPQLPS